MTHRFTITLAGVDALTSEVGETLAAVGLWNDASLPPTEGLKSLSSSGGLVRLGFDREAESLGDAVGSAIQDVERAGFNVARVEMEVASAALIASPHRFVDASGRALPMTDAELRARAAAVIQGLAAAAEITDETDTDETWERFKIEG